MRRPSAQQTFPRAEQLQKLKFDCGTSCVLLLACGVEPDRRIKCGVQVTQSSSFLCVCALFSPYPSVFPADTKEPDLPGRVLSWHSYRKSPLSFPFNNEHYSCATSRARNLHGILHDSRHASRGRRGDDDTPRGSRHWAGGDCRNPCARPQFHHETPVAAHHGIPGGADPSRPDPACHWLPVILLLQVLWRWLERQMPMKERALEE